MRIAYLVIRDLDLTIQAWIPKIGFICQCQVCKTGKREPPKDILV